MRADTPGQPGTPTIEDYDSDMVELAWTRPSHDGGDRIEGFVVEFKEPGEKEWHNATAVPVKDTRTISMCFSSLYDHVDLSQQQIFSYYLDTMIRCTVITVHEIESIAKAA